MTHEELLDRRDWLLACQALGAQFVWNRGDGDTYTGVFGVSKKLMWFSDPAGFYPSRQVCLTDLARITLAE